MNISELARRLKTTTVELHEMLPQLGIDIGRRAIKIDNAAAQRVLRQWGPLQAELLQKKKLAQEPADAQSQVPQEKKTIALPPIITVRDFAVLLNVPVTRLIHVLMNNGILAALNEKIDYDTASIIAEDLGFLPKKEEESQEQFFTVEDPIKELIRAEDPSTLHTRPPIVVVMGHVDHGKTKLLDAIRKTNIMSQESGGITQHIGAYQTVWKVKKTGVESPITFLDTPGHEAFTTMRSRGARVADIAVLVVAADDGVKPQTIEAIKIIKAAQLPIIVALNKIDKEAANTEKVKRELSDAGLIPEDWGGTTPVIPLSAKAGTGVDDLLDVILLVAEIEKEQMLASPKGSTAATVIESHIDKNEGCVATLLVQNGTLLPNDFLVIGNTLYGKVRLMKDHRGSLVASAPPGRPVRIIGFKTTPVIGENVRAYQTLPKHIEKNVKRTATSSVVVVPKQSELKEGKPSVNIVLKTDTLGSLEAIAGALTKTDHPDVNVHIVTKGLGNITTVDILNAEATKSFVAGFHVGYSTSASQTAIEKNIEIKIYKVIYELLDDVRSRIESSLTPFIEHITVGQVKILAVFHSQGHSMIVGGVVMEGSLLPKHRVRVLREGVVVAEGKIGTIQSGKQEVKEGRAGQECGIAYEGPPLIQIGDILEIIREEKHIRTLDNEPPSDI